MPFSVRNLFCSNATLHSRRFSANFEVEKPDRSISRFTVDFYIDRLGRTRILHSKELPQEVSRRYRGTLLHGVLSQMDYRVVQDRLGYRLQPSGSDGVLGYEFTISLADGREGIPFRDRRFSGMREYGDLRNIGFSPELNGATISMRIHSENCDLRNSSYREITTVFRRFQLYDLDGSETLVYSSPPSILRERFYPNYAYPSNRWTFQPYLQFQQSPITGFQPSSKYDSIGYPSGKDSRSTFGSRLPQHIPLEDAQLVEITPLAEIAFMAGFSPMAEEHQAGAVPQLPILQPTGRLFALSSNPSAMEKSRTEVKAALSEKSAPVPQNNGELPAINSGFKPVPFSSLTSFKAAIFDLDGVAVDSEGAHLKSFNKLFSPLGIMITPDFWAKHYSGVGSYAIIKDVFRRNGIRKSVHEWVQKRAEAYHGAVLKGGLRETAGFRQFFSMLAYEGVKEAIASSGHKPHILVSMMAIGIPAVPFVGLEDVKNRKPAPDAFLLAAEKLGVKPSECIVFEDSLAGIRAAAAAGMPCVAIAATLPAKELEGKATLVVNGFSSPELRAQIGKLISKDGKSKGAAIRRLALPGENHRGEEEKPQMGSSEKGRFEEKRKAKLRRQKGQGKARQASEKKPSKTKDHQGEDRSFSASSTTKRAFP